MGNCDGLNENGSHSSCLNVWSLVNGIICKGLGDASLLVVRHWESALRSEKPIPDSVFFLFFTCCLGSGCKVSVIAAAKAC